MQGKTGIIFTFSGIVDKFMEKRYQKSSVPCGGGQPEQQKINTNLEPSHIFIYGKTNFLFLLNLVFPNGEVLFMSIVLVGALMLFLVMSKRIFMGAFL